MLIISFPCLDLEFFGKMVWFGQFFESATKAFWGFTEATEGGAGVGKTLSLAFDLVLSDNCFQNFLHGWRT